MSDQETVNRYRGARSHPERAVLEGFHALKHALRFGAEVTEVRSPEPARLARLARELAPDLAGRLADRAIDTPPALFERLAPRPPDPPVLALARRREADAPSLLRSPERAPVVLLERPSHLGNLGAAVRAAAAAGAAGLVATGEHDPWHASAIRGSTGLHYALPVARGDARRVEPGERRLVAVDPSGATLEATERLPDRSILAFGTERHGLSDRLLSSADRRVRIPMREGVSSLNLAASVAVTLYAWRLGRGG